MKLFLNISNHPSKSWDKDQKEAVNGLFMNNEVEYWDIPYPNIPPQASLEEVKSICDAVVSQVQALKGDNEVVALVQGEMTSLFFLVPSLQKLGIKVVSATTQRVAEEKDGVKTSVFKFCKFREYPIL